MIAAMKKTVGALIVALGLAMALACQTAYADTDASAFVDLRDEGSGTVSVAISRYDKLSDMVSMSLALDITATDGNLAYIEPSFQFSPDIDAAVKTYNTPQMDGVLRVNLYIAGAEGELFPDAGKDGGVLIGNLVLGLKDNAPQDASIQATVTVPTDVVAFNTVGKDYEPMAMASDNLQVPESPTVTLTVQQNGGNGSGTNGGNGTNGGASDVTPSDVTGGNTPNASTGDSHINSYDVVGQTADTRPGKVPATGDNMAPLVTGIVVLIVAAAAVIAVVAVRRRRHQG